MNAQHSLAIDPAVERQLRVAVERAVRPVFAPELRKLTMRRELLGHAVEAFEAEHKGLADRDRLCVTIERLGEPAALTADLQSSVSVAERVSASVERLLRCPRGGSLGKYALRQALVTAVLMTAVFAVVGVLSAAGILSPKAADAGSFRAMVWIVSAFGACAGVGGYFGGRVRQSLEEGRTAGLGVAVLWAALGGLVTLALGWFSFWVCFGMPSAASSARFAACWMLLSAVFAVVLPVLAWLDLRERREIEEWLELTLD